MSVGIAYLLLGISIAFELLAASVTTVSKGFTVLKPTLICIVGYALSYYFFGLCLKKIDLGIGYATWGAVGMVVTAVVGNLIYKEPITKKGNRHFYNNSKHGYFEFIRFRRELGLFKKYKTFYELF